jgi:FkbM family methyltransferase
MSLRSIVRRIVSRPKTDTEKLIHEASHADRYRRHSFTYRGMKLTVTDFISVAWQLKEFFDDGRLAFKSDSPSPVIYDCGANVGVSVLYFKQLFPKANITAFEPDTQVFTCLQQNLADNNITGIQLHNKAVWKNADGILFGSEGADGGSIYFEGNKVQLPSVRLKDMLAIEQRVDLLKMDIEGAEVEVLKDCGAELKKVQYLFVEYHSWINEEQKLDDLLKLLRENGFRYYIHSIGETLKAPFVMRESSNGMDIQLDIHAINEGVKT